MMDPTQAHSHNTELKDRILWFDGDYTVNHNELFKIISAGTDLRGCFVDEITNDIKQYNMLVPNDQQITVKTDVNPHDIEWMLPTEVINLDVREFVISKLYNQLEVDNLIDSSGTVSNAGKQRINRVSTELSLYEHHNLMDVLRVIIFIINTLTEHQAVWGVGRGSSVASYVLFLIGVHDIDSCEYDLDIEEFLHIETTPKRRL